MKKPACSRIALLLCCAFIVSTAGAHAQSNPATQKGLASWYGEEERGNLMANGKKFDPDKLTAASWFYPLGTSVRVTVSAPNYETRSVLVIITDRGPAKRLVQRGRVIDLSHAAFQKIAPSDLGLIQVVVQPVSVAVN
jgi:rare lipoprotein A